jgi:hypothetical protein
MKAKKTQQEPECFCMGFGPEFSRIVSGLGSENARSHFRNARIEALRGLRALIDHRIETLSKTRTRGTTIEVE